MFKIDFSASNTDPGDDFHLMKTVDIRGQHDIWVSLDISILGILHTKQKIHVI